VYKDAIASTDLLLR